MASISLTLEGSSARVSFDRTVHDLHVNPAITHNILSNDSVGPHRVIWSGQSASRGQVGSGLYFYRLTAEGRSETRKMVLLR